MSIASHELKTPLTNPSGMPGFKRDLTARFAIQTAAAT